MWFFKSLKSWSHLETCSILGRYSPLSRTLLPCRAWSQLLGVCWMWLHLRWRSIRADPSSCGLDEQPRMPRNHSFCTHSQPTPRRWDSPELLDGLPEDPGTTSGSTRWLDWFAIDCFPRRRVRGTGRSGTLSGGWLLWGLGLKCGNEMTQGGGMGNGLVGVHVLRMEFACRDFHAHSRPQAEHQSFPKFDCSLSLPTNRFQISRWWPLLCFSLSSCSAASKLWMFWNPGSVSHRSGGRSGKVHFLLNIFRRWCLMSLVDRPQRQQNTPPEGINLRTCPRLTIGSSLTSEESFLTVGWGCGVSDSPYHCSMCVCQMVISVFWIMWRLGLEITISAGTIVANWKHGGSSWIGAGKNSSMWSRISFINGHSHEIWKRDGVPKPHAQVMVPLRRRWRWSRSGDCKPTED